MLLYLVRHAWAGEHGDPRHPDDSQRPLTEKGIKRFQNWLSHFDHAGIWPKAIFTSPFVRCVQTAELLQKWLQKKHHHLVPMIKIDALQPGADLDAVLAEIGDLSDLPRDEELVVRSDASLNDQIWVGHMPDLSFLIEALIGNSRAAIHFTKGTIAAIKFDDAPNPAMGELQWLASPKMFGE